MSDAPLPPHTLAPDPTKPRMPRYPAPLVAADVAALTRNNPVMAVYVELAARYEGEFAEMAAADAKDDEAIARAIVAMTR
jgi:hypothetical protein